MKVTVNHRCADADSFRAARVKSLFNVESGANFTIEADLPGLDDPWQIGLIVGPSGSGKTSLGRAYGPLYAPEWSSAPIIDVITPDLSVNAVTRALAAVGLGSVPTWLRPYNALSNGEAFRANLARLVCEAPDLAVFDEFSSVVDRQIARVGASAFGRAWRTTGGRVVLLSCHYDVTRWLQPDWVFDTATGRIKWRSLRQRPSIELEIYRSDWRYWPAFEQHHYLKLPRMIAADCYVGAVDGVPVAHVAVTTTPGQVEARAARLVVMPEWQGIGVGRGFLNAVSELWLQGENRYGKKLRTLFHTSHPGLAAGLRRRPEWTQISASLYGDNKTRSRASLSGAAARRGQRDKNAGYGGHFRAVQGFRYMGQGSDAL